MPAAPWLPNRICLFLGILRWPVWMHLEAAPIVPACTDRQQQANWRATAYVSRAGWFSGLVV